jgi:hypothetical protein
MAKKFSRVRVRVRVKIRLYTRVPSMYLRRVYISARGRVLALFGSFPVSDVQGGHDFPPTPVQPNKGNHFQQFNKQSGFTGLLSELSQIL